MTATNRRRAWLGPLLAGLVALGADGCAPAVLAAESPIHVADAWARATPPGVDNGAAYCKILNQGAADRLIGARSSGARAAELHTSMTHDGIAEMHRIEALPIGAGSTIELAPGATHVMLLGLASRLAAGERIELTLIFEKAGEVTVEVPILDAREPTAAAHDHEHHSP